MGRSASSRTCAPGNAGSQREGRREGGKVEGVLLCECGHCGSRCGHSVCLCVVVGITCVSVSVCTLALRVAVWTLSDTRSPSLCVRQTLPPCGSCSRRRRSWRAADMRRSAAPSQLSGNPVKRFRFVPPGNTDTQKLGSGTAEQPPLTIPQKSHQVPYENDDQHSMPPSKAFGMICGPNQNARYHSAPTNVDESSLLEKSKSKPSSASLALSPEALSTGRGDDPIPQQRPKISQAFLVPKKSHVLPPPLQQTDPAQHKGEQDTPDSLTKYYNVLWCKASKKKHKKWEGDAILITRRKSVILKDMEGRDIGKDALVMPRPNLSHQWIHNKATLPLVDVVVDPYLCAHLRPHQRVGVIFLYECVMGMRANGRFGAILADEMGLGKTLQCITLLWTLMRQGPYGNKPIFKRSLVITPGSLVKNWNKEFQKWLGTERLKVFAVDQDHKVEDFISSPLYSVLIISYEMLLRCLEQLQNLEFSLIICDEGHRLKNSSIKTSTAILTLPCEKRVILTGTPIQNDLQEFYSIVEFVNPGILGSACIYRKIYEEPIIRSQQPSATTEEKQLGEERAAELYRLTGLFILRRTQDIINNYLPSKTEWIIFCRPVALQLEVYHKLLATRAVKSCLQGKLENSSHLVCIGFLKKLCNHPSLLFNTIKGKQTNSVKPRFGDVLEFNDYKDLAGIFPENYEPGTFTAKDSGKLRVLTDLLAAIHHQTPSERVVLVSNYTQTLDILQEMCKCSGYTYTRLDGHTPVAHRQQIVDLFNSKQSETFIFLLSSKAGGVGLNLIGASRLVLYDIDWNPATDMQAMARIWRDGQRRTVHIYRLLTAGTIEEKIYQRQVSKQGLSGVVVDLRKKSEHASFSVEELRTLFKLDETSSCLTHDLLCCNCGGNGEVLACPTAEKPSTARPCQLGQNSGSASQKHLSMSELMCWKHFSGEIQQFPDPHLQTARENITFIFQNTSKHRSPHLAEGRKEKGNTEVNE
ncbi:DNA repair and recombination protein RAD54B isoform X3 [Callorhinchus milii]|uniref:DNA repair and recombination protein RAD54B isoform X3 n=1 Tax=Callorhinchus milii TaxID=7868 RepID=UPI001C3F9033|nr:DNA repair and recombination protein RAD54B isoform X3 [Callorhinchus milii]